MQYRAPRKDKSPENANKARATLAARINRAASDLNPFLVIVVIGLVILNLTFYLGMFASRHPSAWASAGHTASSISAVPARPGPGTSAARN